MVSISFRKYHNAKKKINLFTWIIKMSTARASSLFLSSYRNTVVNLSVLVFVLGYFLNLYNAATILVYKSYVLLKCLNDIRHHFANALLHYLIFFINFCNILDIFIVIKILLYLYSWLIKFKIVFTNDVIIVHVIARSLGGINKVGMYV